MPGELPRRRQDGPPCVQTAQRPPLRHVLLGLACVCAPLMPDGMSVLGNLWAVRIARWCAREQRAGSRAGHQGHRIRPADPRALSQLSEDVAGACEPVRRPLPAGATDRVEFRTSGSLGARRTNAWDPCTAPQARVGVRRLLDDRNGRMGMAESPVDALPGDATGAGRARRKSAIPIRMRVLRIPFAGRSAGLPGVRATADRGAAKFLGPWPF